MSQVISYTEAECFALNQWLSDSPNDMSYQEIIDCLLDNPDDYYDFDIIPWEPIDGMSGRIIVEYLEDTRQAFERAMQRNKEKE